VFGLTFVLQFLLDGSKSISCRIEDSRLFGSAFLEAHPVAKIDQVYNRWGREFALHHANRRSRDLDEFINDIETSEELGVNSVRWVSKTEVLILDRANMDFDKSLGPAALTSVGEQSAIYDKHNHIELLQRAQHAGIEGQIVVFDDERKFEIIATIPISDVARIQGIRAEFKESSSKEIAKLIELETKASNKKIKDLKESIVPSCLITGKQP
jgi:hypothetical protein